MTAPAADRASKSKGSSATVTPGKGGSQSVERVTRPIFGDELFAFTAGRALWVGLSGRARWLRFDPGGDTLPAVDLEHRPRVATEVEIAAERERLIGDVEPGSAVALVDGRDLADLSAGLERNRIREAPARDRVPAYDAVVAGGGGFWLRRYPLPSDTEAAWLFVDSAGTPVGILRLARDDGVLGGSDRIALVGARDELDAPVLRILRR